MFSLEQSSSSEDGGKSPTTDNSSSGDRPGPWIFEQDPLYRRYQQCNLIGTGKYSEVYAGKDAVTGQEVALKLVDRRKSIEENGARDEYKILSSLCHKNIVSGLAIFPSSPKEYFDTIVMTRVKGLQMLEHICKVDSTEGTIKKLSLQMIYALQYLQSQQIVHGDIKPENVLVESDGTVRIIDFGRSLPDPEFSAPEVHKSEISHPSDAWSFGALLYVSISGVSPFLDDCPEETLNNKCSANFSFPKEYFDGVPEGAMFLIASVLASEPDQRATPNSLLLSSWFKESNTHWTAPVKKLRNFTLRRSK